MLRLNSIIDQRGTRFQVLTYHRVSPNADGVFDPTPLVVFEKQMRHLARYYRVLTAGEAATRASEGQLPPRAVCITFDDGYQDNYHYAFPVLRKYGLRATLFLTTGPLEMQSPLWHDQVFGAFALTRKSSVSIDGFQALLSSPERRWDGAKRFVQYLRQFGEGARTAAVAILMDDLRISPEQAWRRSPMLNWDQVREMAATGWEIGAHTVTHPILATLPFERQEEEIVHSVETIEKRLGIRPQVFAYPIGREADFGDETVRIIQANALKAAFTTLFGTNRGGADPYRLKRGAAWSQELWRYAMQMLLYRYTA